MLDALKRPENIFSLDQLERAGRLDLFVPESTFTARMLPVENVINVASTVLANESYFIFRS